MTIRDLHHPNRFCLIIGCGDGQHVCQQVYAPIDYFYLSLYKLNEMMYDTAICALRIDAKNTTTTMEWHVICALYSHCTKIGHFMF